MAHATFTFRSTVLDMDTTVDVLLPENRKTTKDLRPKTYPVLYILHGKKEDSSTWTRMSNIMLLTRELDLIVVMPSGNNSMYVDAKYGQHYLTYITEELPVKLKNWLPITDDPEQTFIMGESMGGYGAMLCALTHPEQYGRVVSLSSGNLNQFARKDANLDIATGLYGSEEEWLASDWNLYNLLDRHEAAGTKLPCISYYCGTDDASAYASCKELLAYVDEHCPSIKIKREFWPGMHNYFFWNQALPKALADFGFEVVQTGTV